MAGMVEVPFGTELMSSGDELVPENGEEDEVDAVIPTAVPVGESCFNVSRISAMLERMTVIVLTSARKDETSCSSALRSTCSISTAGKRLSLSVKNTGRWLFELRQVFTKSAIVSLIFSGSENLLCF